MVKTIGLLWHTVRYLKPIQFYWRLYILLRRVKPLNTTIKAPISLNAIRLLPSVTKPQVLTEHYFCFLNESRAFSLPMDWQAVGASKLWRYQLHYFDFLLQAEVDHHACMDLMLDWLAQNPAGQGDGWEPYPLSLRIVNWLKFLPLNHDARRQQLVDSLYIQARALASQLEYHLLGNHLFKNAVALLFAGSFFAGQEANQWRLQGIAILEQQLQEQILADGGHFERSPLYHVLILEDVLDCINLLQALEQPMALLSALQQAVKAMWQALMVMLHEDQAIGLFNDSAVQAGPSPMALWRYATTLGLELLPIEAFNHQNYLVLPDFGLYRLQNTQGRLLFDAGNIGPDYLPGHAHCDTLSYELSIAGQRCIVNSGTYQYAGHQRQQFRSTKAHNTVMLDGMEQHEIWATFRVARRGYIVSVQESWVNDALQIAAAHTGYQRLAGRPIHRRQISCYPQHWLVVDEIIGQGQHSMVSYIHLHPAVQIIHHSAHQVDFLVAGRKVSVQLLSTAELSIEASEYAPEFGLSIQNAVIVLRHTGECPMQLAYQIICNP